MIKKLYPFQENAVRDIRKLLKKWGRVVAVSPTGSGKTVIGAALLRALKGSRVLWLAHRIELLRQAKAHLMAAGIPEKDIGILSGPEKHNTGARILVASVDVIGRTYTVPDVDLIVIDEAHHVAAQSYRDIIDARPKAMVLGLTATPERLDGKPLGDVFKYLHVVAEPMALIVDGYLLRGVVYGIPREKARKLVKGAGSGNEYSAIKLERAMKKKPLMADIVTERQRLAPGQPTIVYACTRAHGKAILLRFLKAGVPAAYVDALTPSKEREALLGEGGKLATGEIEVVVNVGVLTEGFDCPPVSCIIVARPTKSLTLWRQMCGRGARTGVGRKKKYLVLDHAGNTWRHGFPDAPIDWSLDGRKKGQGAAPVKLCVECDAMIPISAHKCPECGEEQPLSERELAEQKADLERMRASADERKRKEEILRKLAEIKGLDEEWVKSRLSEVA